ncbi:acyltransferase family protein [Winogradskyella schleiferi]|uniref:acyltransferase family protein n=1 Tax=Winogradskyella schleiferi TaxID=2686078 RepID=UPI0015B97738|nr:acyltransferase [Winogradskyella schleiferi]
MRIEQLTFTRFIAAIAIVVFHFGRESQLFSNDYVDFIFNNANVGVSYFFVLSGFVMIIAYCEKNLSFFDYLKNRFARIYPVYILAIILWLVGKTLHDINKVDLFLNVTMLQSWFSERAQTINYPGWSLSVELFFYVSFPFLLNYIYNKKSLKAITIVILGFWLISQLLYHAIIYNRFSVPIYTVNDIFYHPIMHFNEFLIGNLTGLYFLKKNVVQYNKNYLPHLVLLFLFLLVLLKFKIGLNFHNGLLAIVFVPIIYLLSCSKDMISKIISKKPFVFLGEISYSIYILQVPIWLFLTDYRLKKYFGLNEDLEITLAFMVRLFILIVFSSFCYLYIEKPLRKKIKFYF